jgi:threonine/homoserine/homoserine lactone efflux protein
VVSTGELGGSVVLSAMALLFPILALLLVLLLLWFAIARLRRWARREAR